MGNTDSIPIISQAKSTAQALAGDIEGAKATQMNFLIGCPIVSQTTSIYQYIQGDKEGAKQTQREFMKGINDVADATPGIGHLKSGVHYYYGQSEQGAQALKAASRTTGVMVGGSLGFLAGGPAGSVVGGVAGGVAMDGITTKIESSVYNEYRPAGQIANWQAMMKGEAKIEDYFDSAAWLLMDGLIGYEVGKFSQRFASKHSIASGAMKVAMEEGLRKSFPQIAKNPAVMGMSKRAFLEEKAKRAMIRLGSKALTKQLVAAGLSPGTVMNYQKLAVNAQNLLKLGLAGELSLGHLVPQDNKKTPLEVKMAESPKITRENVGIEERVSSKKNSEPVIQSDDRIMEV